MEIGITSGLDGKKMKERETVIGGGGINNGSFNNVFSSW